MTVSQGVCEGTGPGKHGISSWNIISLQVFGGMLEAGGIISYLKMNVIFLSRMQNLHEFLY